MRYIVIEVQNNADGSVTFPSDPRQKVYDDISKAAKEYSTERHIGEEVISDIASFLNEN